jgi:hypothetical protein
MEYSFPRYLLAKQSVDERALNHHVYDMLLASLPPGPLAITEVGAGIGTMLVRLIRRGLVTEADYVMVDELAENADYAREWIPQQAAQAGLGVERIDRSRLRLRDRDRDIHVTIVQADVFDFIRSRPAPADLLIAHAFLDLLPLPASLDGLFALVRPAGLAWLTLNFDGLTTLEPAIDPDLDTLIEHLYHATMDARPTGGDSRCGRHLFGHLRAAGREILAAGASDWTVFAQQGRYPADEAYFLQHILYFFESALSAHPGLADGVLAAWLATRRAQVEHGELVYVAHQMDFLARA